MKRPPMERADPPSCGERAWCWWFLGRDRTWTFPGSIEQHRLSLVGFLSASGSISGTCDGCWLDCVPRLSSHRESGLPGKCIRLFCSTGFVFRVFELLVVQ